MFHIPFRRLQLLLLWFHRQTSGARETDRSLEVTRRSHNRLITHWKRRTGPWRERERRVSEVHSTAAKQHKHMSLGWNANKDAAAVEAALDVSVCLLLQASCAVVDFIQISRANCHSWQYFVGRPVRLGWDRSCSYTVATMDLPEHGHWSQASSGGQASASAEKRRLQLRLRPINFCAPESPRGSLATSC
jgi:hypothetical protein